MIRSIAYARAQKAGSVLADVIINRAQGRRPINLIGYSLGSRVIFSCLLSLAARGEFGLIENVYLLGAPVQKDVTKWRTARAMVSGRMVNVYSENDYILAFLYRTASIQLGVAGLQPIENVHGVENIDASDLVSGHLRYRYLLGKLLSDRVGAEDISADRARVQQEKEQPEELAKSPPDDTIKAEDKHLEDVAAEIEKERTSRNQPPIPLEAGDT